VPRVFLYFTEYSLRIVNTSVTLGDVPCKHLILLMIRTPNIFDTPRLYTVIIIMSLCG